MTRTLLNIAVALAVAFGVAASARGGVQETIELVQPRVVKIYGAGGFRGLEAYQSGILVSAEGHVLTVWSHVLDTDYLIVVPADGRRLAAKLVGADPRLEIALLKLEGNSFSHFDLNQAVDAEPGARVLAFSNLFGVATGSEPVSVQHGVISTKAPLEGRRGVFETPYNGPVYVIDAVTNNPGAAGGALVTRRGELVGLLGNELRNARNNTWLNYAIPINELRNTVEQIRGGKFVARSEEQSQPKPPEPLTLDRLGIVLVPDVVDRTPPFVDRVRPGSPAAAAGIRPDDLVVFVGDRLVQSCRALRAELEYIDAVDEAQLTLLRGQELVPVTLRAPADNF